MMDRVLFGDNQFFGVNHMSEEKARAQSMRFQDLQAVIDVLDAAYQEGRKFVKQNNFKAAITKLKKAVAADPKHADAQNLLGYAYRKTGDYDSALVHYNEALALDPDHADAHEYIGEAYLELDDLAKAEEHLVALERICPSGCEQRDELAAQVAAYKASHGG